MSAVAKTSKPAPSDCEALGGSIDALLNPPGADPQWRHILFYGDDVPKGAPTVPGKLLVECWREAQRITTDLQLALRFEGWWPEWCERVEVRMTAHTAFAMDPPTSGRAFMSLRERAAIIVISLPSAPNTDDIEKALVKNVQSAKGLKSGPSALITVPLFLKRVIVHEMAHLMTPGQGHGADYLKAQVVCSALVGLDNARDIGPAVERVHYGRELTQEERRSSALLATLTGTDEDRAAAPAPWEDEGVKTIAGDVPGLGDALDFMAKAAPLAQAIEAAEAAGETLKHDSPEGKAIAELFGIAPALLAAADSEDEETAKAAWREIEEAMNGRAQAMLGNVNLTALPNR